MSIVTAFSEKKHDFDGSVNSLHSLSGQLVAVELTLLGHEEHD